MGNGNSCLGSKSDRDLKFTTIIRVVLRLKMRNALPLHPICLHANKGSKLPLPFDLANL
jgi:hypothetical protein